ncbi:hypothetical protein L208DRAFT_1357932 [Tricholoma matsutake]|nr:hypothetical protein L208DRAFT_1357932 [Tricholoma matsutake 945]
MHMYMSCKRNSSLTPLQLHAYISLFQVFYSEEQKNALKHCFSDMMAVVERPGGVHSWMVGVLDKVFSHVNKVGGNIGRHKRSRLSQRTWKDSNTNTLYLD